MTLQKETKDSRPAAAVQSEIMTFLADPGTHGCREPVKRIDTHAAVIFLAGDSALKLKRAVKFPFLDYSTVDLRRIACEREIELNRPAAPMIYRDTVPITRDAGGGLALDGAGHPVDWVVRMHRFDEDATLDRLAERGALPLDLAEPLADVFATAHAGAPRVEAEQWIDDLEDYVDQNRTAFLAAPELFKPDRVRMLSAEAHAMHARIRALLEQRGRMGFVRRCHGDGHLGNIVLIEGQPVLFDAVEFDDRVATGDVLYDLAFVLMDLWDRGCHPFANRVLNRYMLKSHSISDLEDLGALPFFLMMRAAIRAKVIAASLPHLDPKAAVDARAQAQRYFEFAERFLEAAPPMLIAIGGLSGTGKTTVARAIAPALGHPPGALVLRSDEERKIMYGLEPTEKLPPEAYRAQTSDEVYSRLGEKARAALAAGHSVIVDAVFSSPREREAIEAVALHATAGFRGYWLEAEPDILVERVEARHGDASDADAGVVQQQLSGSLGEIGWRRIDAGGTREETAERLRLDLDRHRPIGDIGGADLA